MSVLSAMFRLGVHHSEISLGVFALCYSPPGSMKAVLGGTAEILIGLVGTSLMYLERCLELRGPKSLLCTLDMGLAALNV